MEWYCMLSNFITGTIQFGVGILLIAEIQKFQKTIQQAGILSLIAGIVVTVFSFFIHAQAYTVGLETILLAAIIYFFHRENFRMSLFLAFFYEIEIAMWQFLISAILAMRFRSGVYADETKVEYLFTIWIVRILFISIAVIMNHTRSKGKKITSRFVAVLMFLGMFGIITVAGQPAQYISEDKITTWVMLAPFPLMAVLFFNMNRQYEIEKELTRAKAEQAELLERDYQALENLYASNSRLYHDIHNHMEALYHYLSLGQTDKALSYLKELQAPIQEMAQTIWTGDEAVDYLLNSKIALAKKEENEVSLNIEFPHHTNIRSTDLVAILGNLFDNALEATRDVEPKKKRIGITIRRINDILVIKVENGCRDMPIIENGLIQTTKKDTKLHGWGLKSAAAAADNYDGTIETSYHQGTFCVVTTLFFHSIGMQ